MKKFILIITTVIILISIAAFATCVAPELIPSYLNIEQTSGEYGDNSYNDFNYENDALGETEEQNSPNSQNEDQTPNSKEEPQPKNDKDILFMSEISSLNIRSGPSTSYKIVGSLKKGAMVPLVEKVNSGWYKTVYKGKDAYVSSSYTKEVEFEKGSTLVEKVIDEAKKLLGFPYVWGAQRYHWGPPNSKKNPNFVMGEFDCSSLTQYAFFIGAGVVLDLTTRTQVHQGVEIKREKIKRGDLMFFTNSSRRHLSGNERVGHVAIYLGNNYIIHTASTVAIIEPISSLRWSYYITTKRVI